MKAELHKEHEWLQQLVGEWTFEATMLSAPDQTAETYKGTETVRTLDGVWVLCEGRGEASGSGESDTLMTLGYDPAKGRFVGSFVAGMMTNMWVYEGQLDSSGKVLVMDTEGPSFTDPARTAKYKDSVEIVNPDQRVLRSKVQLENGEWFDFMTSKYRRVK